MGSDALCLNRMGRCAILHTHVKSRQQITLRAALSQKQRQEGGVYFIVSSLGCRITGAVKLI